MLPFSCEFWGISMTAHISSCIDRRQLSKSVIHFILCTWYGIFWNWEKKQNLHKVWKDYIFFLSKKTAAAIVFVCLCKHQMHNFTVGFRMVSIIFYWNIGESHIKLESVLYIFLLYFVYFFKHCHENIQEK